MNAMSKLYNDLNELEKELEHAAFMFLNVSVWDQAAALFALLASRMPNYTVAWYGLSNAFLNFSFEKRDIGILQTAYAFGLRALKEDPADRFSAELLAAMREKTPLGDMGVSNLAPYQGNPEQIAEKLLSANRLVEAFRRFPIWEERLRLVMYLGDQNNEAFVPLLAYALEHDENSDVRMGAMKRLGYWGNHRDVRPVCERIAATGTWQEIEPYFTMGLHGMSTEWAAELADQLSSY